jgi:hypothetical protein
MPHLAQHKTPIEVHERSNSVDSRGSAIVELKRPGAKRKAIENKKGNKAMHALTTYLRA